MKKILLCTTLLMLSVFSPLSIADIPNQVSLHYTGTIITKPCEVSLGSTTTLDMGDLDIATLLTAGATSQWLNYIIHFSNCDVSTNIVLYTASGTVYGPIQGKIGTFATYDSQSAVLKNIGLQVMASVGGVDNLNMYDTKKRYLVITPTQHDGQDLTSYDLPIKFSFINVTGAAPEPGNITGVYTMTIEYS